MEQVILFEKNSLNSILTWHWMQSLKRVSLELYILGMVSMTVRENIKMLGFVRMREIQTKCQRKSNFSIFLLVWYRVISVPC